MVSVNKSLKIVICIEFWHEHSAFDDWTIRCKQCDAEKFFLKKMESVPNINKVAFPIETIYMQKSAKLDEILIAALSKISTHKAISFWKMTKKTWIFLQQSNDIYYSIKKNFISWFNKVPIATKDKKSTNTPYWDSFLILFYLIKSLLRLCIWYGLWHHALAAFNTFSYFLDFILALKIIQVMEIYMQHIQRGVILICILMSVYEKPIYDLVIKSWC